MRPRMDFHLVLHGDTFDLSTIKMHLFISIET